MADEPMDRSEALRFVGQRLESIAKLDRAIPAFDPLVADFTRLLAYLRAQPEPGPAQEDPDLVGAVEEYGAARALVAEHPGERAHMRTAEAALFAAIESYASRQTELGRVSPAQPSEGMWRAYQYGYLAGNANAVHGDTDKIARATARELADKLYPGSAP